MEKQWCNDAKSEQYENDRFGQEAQAVDPPDSARRKHRRQNYRRQHQVVAGKIDKFDSG